MQLFPISNNLYFIYYFFITNFVNIFNTLPINRLNIINIKDKLTLSIIDECIPVPIMFLLLFYSYIGFFINKGML